MKTEKIKMLAGELYDPADLELAEERMLTRERCHTLNQSSPREESLRRDVLTKLFASGGDAVWLEPPFRCDYGTNIHLGEKVYFNFDCVILSVRDQTFHTTQSNLDRYRSSTLKSKTYWRLASIRIQNTRPRGRSRSALR